MNFPIDPQHGFLPSGHAGGQRSLREIAAELERAGDLNERGARYSAASVQHMLAQRG
jgi:hypothetical protein